MTTLKNQDQDPLVRHNLPKVVGGVRLRAFASPSELGVRSKKNSKPRANPSGLEVHHPIVSELVLKKIEALSKGTPEASQMDADWLLQKLSKRCHADFTQEALAQYFQTRPLMEALWMNTH